MRPLGNFIVEETHPGGGGKRGETANARAFGRAFQPDCVWAFEVATDSYYSNHRSKNRYDSSRSFVGKSCSSSGYAIRIFSGAL